MDFEIVGEITVVETIAAGKGIAGRRSAVGHLPFYRNRNPPTQS
jgi:hypothetical protein